MCKFRDKYGMIKFMNWADKLFKFSENGYAREEKRIEKARGVHMIMNNNSEMEEFALW